MPVDGARSGTTVPLSFELNGTPITTDCHPTALLLDVVRALGWTGTKEGCAVGVCGACTVLVDDLPVSACLYLAACADGASVWTVEGLADRFPEVADAFVRCEGMQCGICTPGQVAAVCALRMLDPGADDQRIRQFLSGNLCRCTGYGTILDAAREALRHD